MTATLMKERAGEALTAAHVEELLSRSGRPTGGIELDLSSLKHVDVRAGWRLAHALSYWSEHGDVVVKLPEPSDRFSGSWFRLFTRAGLGVALAAHASRITVTGRDVTEEVRSYYGNRDEFVGQGHVLIPSIDDGSYTADENSLGAKFSEWFSIVGRDSLPALHDWEPIVKLAYEAVVNVEDHAFKEPYDSRATRLSYLSLSFFSTVSAERGSDFHRHRKAVPETDEGGAAQVGWIELIVHDNGTGIAGRQSQDSEIYRGDLRTEEESTLSALAAGGTVKFIAHDAIHRGRPGYGYTWILDSLRKLHAYAELRTGRLNAHYSSEEERHAFAFDRQQQPYIPGTTLEILFPIYARQLTLPV